MTEMSISREDKVASPKSEPTEPGIPATPCLTPLGGVQLFYQPFVGGCFDPELTGERRRDDVCLGWGSLLWRACSPTILIVVFLRCCPCTRLCTCFPCIEKVPMETLWHCLQVVCCQRWWAVREGGQVIVSERVDPSILCSGCNVLGRVVGLAVDGATLCTHPNSGVVMANWTAAEQHPLAVCPAREFGGGLGGLFVYPAGLHV